MENAAEMTWWMELRVNLRSSAGVQADGLFGWQQQSSFSQTHGKE